MNCLFTLIINHRMFSKPINFAHTVVESDDEWEKGFDDSDEEKYVLIYDFHFEFVFLIN